MIVSSKFRQLAKILLVSNLIYGCSHTPKPFDAKLSETQLSQLNKNNSLISDIEQFVQTSLFQGMIQVRKQNRLMWNNLLSVYACGSESGDQQVPSLLNKMQLDFQASMRLTAEQLDVFSSEKELAIIADVSQTAFRLFSATYAKGYARQIALANEINNRAQDDFCGGQVNPVPADLSAFVTNLSWQASEYVDGSTELALSPHLKHGIAVFSKTIERQGKVFEALVYSHAYQRTEQYEHLFFEVNKFENVQRYSASVFSTLDGHSDFAYLVLSSGYHWGMMSVLAILEQDFPDLHQHKKRLSEKLIDEVSHKKIR